jgi:hypothetical protein
VSWWLDIDKASKGVRVLNRWAVDIKGSGTAMDDRFHSFGVGSGLTMEVE